jgi:hypothetical protein
MTHPTHLDPLAELRRKAALQHRIDAKIVELLRSHDPLLHSFLSLDAKLALIVETVESLPGSKTATAGRSTAPVCDQEPLVDSSEE